VLAVLEQGSPSSSAEFLTSMTSQLFGMEEIYCSYHKWRRSEPGCECNGDLSLIDDSMAVTTLDISNPKRRIILAQLHPVPLLAVRLNRALSLQLTENGEEVLCMQLRDIGVDYPASSERTVVQSVHGKVAIIKTGSVEKYEGVALCLAEKDPSPPLCFYLRAA